MKNILGRLFRRITGISTPLGGLSWEPSRDEPAISAFRGTICITSKDNQTFVAFAEEHSGSVAFLDVTLDACVATSEQMALVEREDLDLGRVGSGDISGMHLSLPNDVTRTEFVRFELLGGRRLNLSTGGTGCVFLSLIGFFELSTTFNSGPSRTFHLREVEAPLEWKAKYLAKP